MGNMSQLDVNFEPSFLDSYIHKYMSEKFRKGKFSEPHLLQKLRDGVWLETPCIVD